MQIKLLSEHVGAEISGVNLAADLPDDIFDRTIHGDAMHQSSPWQLVVADRKMLGHAVVPHQEIADPPAVPVAELRPRDELAQFLDERQALFVCHAANPDALAFAHVDRLAAGDGMRPDDGVLDVRHVLHQIGELAAGGIFLRPGAMDRAQAGKLFLHLG